MTVVRRGLLLSLVLGAGLACLLPAQEPASESAKLTYKVAQKWTYILPQETWSPVSGSIPIPHAGGPGFVAETQGTALAIDTNGDGKVDEKVKGIKGLVTLKAKNAEGQTFSYAIRLAKTGETWTYATSGAVTGAVKGESITIIDQNNNGSFNDFGMDAMIVGDGEAASFLSKVINVDGQLFGFEVTKDGRTANLSAWAGETGTLKVREGFKGTGKIAAVIVANAAGDVSFNAATAKGGLKVPVGDYLLRAGYITQGTESVRMRQGRMAPISVPNGAPVDLAWGGPVTVEFTHSIQGEKLTIPYTSLKYFGKSGEEYFNFLPDATSPIIKVVDSKTGLVVSQGRFGGC